MNQIAQDIRNVEISLETAKANIALDDAVSRLYANKDFQAVILQGYFRDEAVRVVSARSNPCVYMEQNAGQAKMIEDIITSVGGLQQYFITTKLLADQSRQAMVADEETHSELMQEHLDVDTV